MQRPDVIAGAAGHSTLTGILMASSERAYGLRGPAQSVSPARPKFNGQLSPPGPTPAQATPTRSPAHDGFSPPPDAPGAALPVPRR